jgi:PAS domain S-box-containing protein
MPRPSVPLDAIRQPALLFDAEGRIAAANDLAEAVAGRPLAGRSNAEAIRTFRPDGTPITPAELPACRALSGEVVVDAPLRIVLADGQALDILATASPIRDGDAIAGALVVWQNVTENNRAETALRKSEEEYRYLVEYAPTGIFEIDYSGPRFRRVNDAMCRILGYTREELLAMDPAALLDEESRERLRERVRKVAAGEPIDAAVSFRLFARDGREIWAALNVKPLYTGGRMDGALVVAHDVTERKRIEEVLRASLEQLAFGQRAARSGFWDWAQPPNGLLTWSPEFYELFGLDPSAPPSLDLWLATIHPEDRKAAMEKVVASIRERTWLVNEYRILLPAGTERWIGAYGDTTYDTDGRPLRTAGICFDITERKRAEAVLHRYADELERSNEELQRFAYVASHDLQEPLRSIVSFSQLLERRYKGRLDADADDYIAFIVEGGVRMRNLIRDLLQFSRLETQARNPVPADAGRAVTDALELHAGQLAELGGSVTVGQLPTVLADPAQLEQVFVNLVGNAIKYRQPDTAPEIAISARRTDGWWEFAVADNSIGIEAEYFDRIFEMFRRLHTHDKYEGTGIGLAVVKRIVERHGGRIWVESTPGVGSTFFFTLPVA